MARSAAEPWQPYLSQLSSALFKAVGERYYKIAAEALRACEQLVRIIRPNLSQPISQQHLVGLCKGIMLPGSALHLIFSQGTQVALSLLHALHQLLHPRFASP